MPAEYGNAKTYLGAARQELIDVADKGTVGQGAIVVGMFKLMDATEAQARATNELNRKLLWFTIAIALLSGVLVILGLLQFGAARK